MTDQCETTRKPGVETGVELVPGLKDVMAAKPDGAPAPWIGCVPSDLDPNKERQLQH